jgi:hypothetical protein
MPHHFARKFQTLSIVALFALIVTTLATLASWAQVTNVRRASSESSALSEPAVINAALAQPHPLPPEPATLSAGGIAQNRKFHARPQDSGNPLFLPAVPYNANGSATESVAIADVNGDGKPDLIVADQGCVTCGDGSASVLLGNGDGTFQPGVPYDSGGRFTNFVAVADVNGDGKPDLITVNYSPRPRAWTMLSLSPR